MKPTLFSLLVACWMAGSAHAQFQNPWQIWEGWAGTFVVQKAVDLNGDQVNDVALTRIYRGQANAIVQLEVTATWTVQPMGASQILGEGVGLAVLQAEESLSYEATGARHWTNGSKDLGVFECTCALHHVPPLSWSPRGPFATGGYVGVRIQTIEGPRLAWVQIPPGPFKADYCPADAWPTVDFGFQADPNLPLVVGKTRSEASALHYRWIDCNRDGVADVTVERRFRIQEGLAPDLLSVTLVGRPGVQFLVSNPTSPSAEARRYLSDWRVTSGEGQPAPGFELGAFAKAVPLRWIIPEFPSAPLAWSAPGGFAVVRSFDPQTGQATGPLSGGQREHFIVRLDGTTADAIVLEPTGDGGGAWNFTGGYGSVGESLYGTRRIHCWDINGDDLVDFTEVHNDSFTSERFPPPGFSIIYWDTQMISVMFAENFGNIVSRVPAGSTIPAALAYTEPWVLPGFWNVASSFGEIGALYPIAAMKNGAVHAGWIKILNGRDSQRRAEIYLSPNPGEAAIAGAKVEPEGFSPALKMLFPRDRRELDQIEWNVWDALNRGYGLEWRPTLAESDPAPWQRILPSSLYFSNENGATVAPSVRGGPRFYRLTKP